jgi:hypothetical protein
MTAETTALNTLIDFPSVVRQLAPLADRDEIRYALGLRGASYAIVKPALVAGQYRLFTPEQVEFLRLHFQRKAKHKHKQEKE